MASNAVRVGCYCGWRGRRVPRECACYDEYALYCHCVRGYCPKCKGVVYTMWTMRANKEMDKLEGLDWASLT